MVRPRHITWTPVALRDLREIFDYIAVDSRAEAKAFIERIIRSTEKLARFPKRGRTIPEIGHSRYRELIVGPYRIFHEIRKKEVFIFRVFHSRRLF